MERAEKTVEDDKCKGIKRWTEKELNKAAVEIQLQMRYWEED